MTAIRAYRLFCSECDFSQRCAEEQVIDRLARAGKIRAHRPPEWEILRELFLANLSQLPCPDCGRQTLRAEPATMGDWGDDEQTTRLCEGCRKPIPRERLEALPRAVLCAGCQQKEERGESLGPVEYCPRCGSPMVMAPTGGSRITRYRMVCSARRNCR